MNNTVPGALLGLRVLTGRVGKVKEWMSLELPFSCVYVIHGRLLSKVNTGTEYSNQVHRRSFVLMDIDDNAQKLRCTFNEIDRELGNIHGGARVVAVGTRKPDGSLLCLSLDIVDCSQDCHLPRMENFAIRGIRQGLHFHNEAKIAK